MRSVLCLDSILAPSLWKIPDKLSMPAALFVKLLKNIHDLAFVHMRKSKRPIEELNVIVVVSDIIRIVLRGGSWKLFD